MFGKKYILLYLIAPIILNCSTILDDSSFITIEEYGAMLYKNPRGIGCNKCHGKDANGKFIISYRNKKEQTIKIYAPSLIGVNKSIFFKKLKGTKNNSSIMPTYFLTNKEINSIYQYIVNLSNTN